jgi:hypothetical protein
VGKVTAKKNTYSDVLAHQIPYSGRKLDLPVAEK